MRQNRKFTDAWWRLEDLPPIDRAEPEVIALRLQLCADLGHWELGCSLSAVLRFAYDESHKITGAEFHHAYARVLVDTGEIDKAKEQIKEAVALWLTIRLEIIENALLKPLWDSMATEWP